jgi:protein-S-isoprenylcysteine O-methyltransferase Ste14
LQIGVWVPTLAECAIVLANRGLLPDGWNEQVLRFFTGSPLPGRVAHTLSPLLVSAAGLALAGAYVRTSAYRALGRQFTYDLALGQDYRLVTSFPYNLVRHPAYLGAAAVIASVGLSAASRDGWTRAVLVPWVAAAPTDPRRAAAAAYAAGLAGMYALTLMMFGSRVHVEDAMLRKQFGQQWDEWSKRVPNQIIPYVW